MFEQIYEFFRDNLWLIVPFALTILGVVLIFDQWEYLVGIWRDVTDLATPPVKQP